MPVFWLATDDHDFAEVNHVDLLDQSGQLQRISYEDRPLEERVPVGGLKFSAEIEACVDALDEMTPPSEFKPEILSSLKKAYQPRADLCGGILHLGDASLQRPRLGAHRPKSSEI